MALKIDRFIHTVAALGKFRSGRARTLWSRPPVLSLASLIDTAYSQSQPKESSKEDLIQSGSSS